MANTNGAFTLTNEETERMSELLQKYTAERRPTTTELFHQVVNMGLMQLEYRFDGRTKRQEKQRRQRQALKFLEQNTELMKSAGLASGTSGKLVDIQHQ